MHKNIVTSDTVAVKLEPIINGSSSVQHEYYILKQLKGRVGIPHAFWFGRESTYHALVLDLLGSSLHNLFLAHNRKFSLHTVVNLADQLVSQFVVGLLHIANPFTALTSRVHPLT
jgi:hypothetical protein